jgi:glycosyltransferase involved in cell wall biosynthesis
MFEGKKVIVIMPAYNAERTLEKTYHDIPEGIVDEVILCDDHSHDRTVEMAMKLGLTIIRHEKNKGYGANQKACYEAATRNGADFIVMVHPDYQYDPRVIPFALGFLATDICDVVIGSRIRSRDEALKGGMPVYKYLFNRMLTAMENIVFGQNLGDFHSGFRVYRREVLERINYLENADGFSFDIEFLAQAVYSKFKIGDIPIPARYSSDSSSIGFKSSVAYGLRNLLVMAKYSLQETGIARFRLFKS